MAKKKKNKGTVKPTLSACPFCGGTKVRMFPGFRRTETGVQHFFECNSCSAIVVLTTSEDSKHKTQPEWMRNLAIEAWNERASAFSATANSKNKKESFLNALNELVENFLAY